MSIVVMGSGSGLNNTKLKLADADTTDVLKGKKFYSSDKELKTGTLELTGNANADDVLKGATFYKDNAKSKVTGTLELTGNAGAGDVLSGKTFYNTDAKTRITGTMHNNGRWPDADRFTLENGKIWMYKQDGYTEGGLGSAASQLGNASSGHVLSGVSASSQNGIGFAGTMANNGNWGTTLAPGGSATVPAGYHNGSGVVNAGSISSYLKGGSSLQDAAGAHFIYTIPSGTLIGVTRVSLPAAAAQEINPGVSVWIDGNTIHVELGRVGGYVTISVSYVYY